MLVFRAMLRGLNQVQLISNRRVPAVNPLYLRPWKYMKAGARGPDILVGDAGGMQFYPTNEINLEF